MTIYILWEVSPRSKDIVFAYNKEMEKLGQLRYQRLGRFIHWCWYQERGIFMSPGCLQEVRNKQKSLLKERNDKNKKDWFGEGVRVG